MIIEKLSRVASRDAGSMAEACFSASVHIAGDLADEAEHVIRQTADPVVCEACRGDCRQHPSVFFADVMIDGTPTRWFRLCERCGARLNAEDDGRVLFLGRIWPEGNNNVFRNGWMRFM